MSGSSQQVEYELVKPQIEVGTNSHDDEFREVMATPTDFTVDSGDDRRSWERARVFFTQFTASSKPVREVYGSKMRVLSNDNNDQTKYHYTVERSEAPQGYRYRVTCDAVGGARDDKSVRNAKNLARFIRQGNLEASLLAN